MLISVFDPALLFYKLADWQHEEEHCFHRFAALAVHSQIMQEYGLRMAMSDDLESLIYSSFPWNAASQGIGKLHDLRNFILQDMQTAKCTVDIRVFVASELEPAEGLCEHVEEPEVIDAWEELLCSCVATADSRESVIATWGTPTVCECRSVNLTIHDPDSGPDDQYDIPLVWDDGSWATQLVEQDWWPDLQKCVELEFKTNPGIRNHQMVREQPIPFEFAEEFHPSLVRFCTNNSRRRSLVEALTKKVYGIPVKRRRDKQIEKNKWRFWVTDFWRVHYRPEDDRIVLLRFGPHDMDGIG